jgi:hypothetical protein
VATGGRGGFMFGHSLCGPRDQLQMIVDLLIPEVQRRGRFRRAYPGRTLHETLPADRPPPAPGVGQAEASVAMRTGAGKNEPSRATMFPSKTTSFRGGCAATASGTQLAAIVTRLAAAPTVTS